MRNQNGFTLIELIVALLVLAIGLMGLLTMSVHSIRLARDNDLWTVARMMAQAQTEEISGENHVMLMTWPRHQSFVEEHEAISYTVDRWLTPLGGNTDPLEITVRVRYPGFAHGVSVTTMKTFFL
jgi:prepilin-type N-terminal cleavage/methylation domain-containing protein